MDGDMFGMRVDVKISPDTRGFREKLLHDLEWLRDMDARVPVNFDPDTSAVDREMSVLEGRNLTQHVMFDPDMRRLDESLQRLHDQENGNSVRVEADTTGFDRDIDRMLASSRNLRREAGRPVSVSVDSRGLDEAVRASQRLADKQNTVRDRVARLSAQQEQYRQRLSQVTSELQKAGRSGEASASHVKRLSDSVQRLTARAERTGAAVDKAKRELASLGRQADRSARNVRQLSQQWAEASHLISSSAQSVRLPQGLDTVGSRVESRLREQSRAMEDETRSADSLSRALQQSGRSWGDYASRVREANLLASQARNSMRVDEESVRALRQQVESLQRSLTQLQSAHRLGVGNNSAFREAEHQIDAAKDALDALARHGRVDMDSLERGFASASAHVDRFKQSVEEADRQRVQVEFAERNYEHVVDQIDSLERRRVDVPVELKADLDSIRNRWAELREQAKNGKDITFDLDLDLKTRKAREEINRFQRRNNELKMDVDLETALASAHLAEFTRPRVINVFARLHTTDLGKIAYGATYGATGLGALGDQFDRLVQLFDKIDKRVPLYTGIANTFTALGAGMVNLTQSTFGLGAGLVSLSKAAFAAPSALIGLGSAFGTFKLIMSANSKDLKEYFSSIGDTLEKSFRITGNSGLRELNNILLPRLERGLGRVAQAEGRLFNSFVHTTNQAISGPARQLPTIFNDTSRAIDRLTPGVDSLWRSMLGLGSDTSKYLPRMAGWVDRVAESWARWLKGAEATGRIDYALQGVIQQGHLFVQSMRDVITFAQGLWRALDPKSHGLEGFEATLASMSRAVNSVRFQNVMGAWSHASQDAAHQIRGSFSTVARSADALRRPIADLIRQSGSIVSTIMSDGSRLISSVGPGLDTLVKGTSEGLHEIIHALAGAHEPINSLLRMIGDMSRTFGGTFAATLRATAPLIEAVANAADTVANAFNKLPEPIRAAIGMYATWGRAGANLYRTLKTGILDNIQQMLRYRQMLGSLGIAVDSMSEIRLPNLLRAWRAAYSGDASAGISALSAGLGTVGSRASAAAGEARSLGAGVREAGAAASVASAAGSSLGASLASTGTHASRLGGFLGGAKSAMNGLIDAAGGWPAVAVTLAFTGLNAAISDVETHAEEARNALNSMHDAAMHISDIHAKPGSGARAAMAGATRDRNNVDVGLGPGKDWATSIATAANSYKTASSAMKELGITQSQLNGYFEKGSKGVGELRDRLLKLQDSGIAVTDSGYVAYTNKQAEAAETLSETIDKLIKSYKSYRSGVADVVGSTNMINQMNQKASDSFNQIGLSIRANGGVGSPQSKKLLQDAAQQAIILANSIQSDSKAYGGQAKATQTAKNVIQQYRESLVSQLESAGLSEQAANQLADALGLQASKWNNLRGVTRGTADAFMNVANVTNDVRARVDRAIDNKTIRSWSDLQKIIKALERDPGKKIVFTADGHAVALTAKQCREYGVKWNGTRFVSQFDAKDLTSPKISKIIHNWQTQRLHIQNLKAILDANPSEANAKIDNVKNLAKGLGLTKAVVKIITSGAKPTAKQINDIKKQLSDKGFTNAQIKVALGLLNITSLKKQVDDQKKKASQGKPANVPVGANTKKFRNDVNEAKSQVAHGKPANIPVKADTKKATNDIKALTKQVTGLKGKNKNLEVKVKSVTDAASKKIKALQKQVDTLKKQKPTVKANAEVRAAQSKIKSLQHQLNALRKARATVSVSASDRASAKFRAVRGALERIPRSHMTIVRENGSAHVVSNAERVRATIQRIQKSHLTKITESGAREVVGWAHRVKDAVRSIPSKHSTKLTAHMDGSWGAVRGSIDSYVRSISEQTVTIHVRRQDDGSGHALGGRIVGPGSETSDSIPAMLSRNEMVINAASVHKIDARYPGLLDRMNAVGDVPGVPPIRLAEGTVTLSHSMPSLPEGSDVRMLTNVFRQTVQQLQDKGARVQYVQNVTNNMHTVGSQNVQAALLASKMRGQTQDLLNIGGVL